MKTQPVNKNMNNLLTASRMGSLLACPRQHFWKYEVGLQSTTETTALRFGSAWHRAMETRAKGGDFDACLAAAVPEGCDFDELTVATLAALLRGYIDKYTPDIIDEKSNPETAFSYNLEGSRTFTVAGVMDNLARLTDGRLVIFEHKTTSESIDSESDYWLRLRFNTQLYQYILAARGMGWDVSVVVYDVVRKPAIEPRLVLVVDESGSKIVLDAQGQRVFKKDGSPRESADKEKGFVLQSRIETPREFADRLLADTQERPDFYFARREVPILEDELNEFTAQRLTLSRMILSCRQMEKRVNKREQAWPRNVTSMQCKGCFFSSFCLQNISVDTNRLPAGFEIKLNPELTSQ